MRKRLKGLVALAAIAILTLNISVVFGNTGYSVGGSGISHDGELQTELIPGGTLSCESSGGFIVIEPDGNKNPGTGEASAGIVYIDDYDDKGYPLKLTDLGEVDSDGKYHYYSNAGDSYTLPEKAPTGYQAFGYTVSHTGYYQSYSQDYDPKTVAEDIYKVTLKGASPITYVINYDLRGGSGNCPSQEFEYGAEGNIHNGAGVTKEGYTFKEWSLSENGNNPVLPGTAWSLLQSSIAAMNLNVDAAGKASPVTLYAQYEPVEFSIRYDMNGGIKTDPTAKDIEDTKFNYGDSDAIAENGAAYEKNGRKFLYWTTSPNGSGIKYNAGDSVYGDMIASYKQMAAGGMTLYAQYEKEDTFTIKFDPNGGSGPEGEVFQTVKIGEETELNTNMFTRDGYTFTGWNTKADGTGTAYQDKQVVKDLAGSGENLTLYAQWTQNGIVATGDGNITIVLAVLLLSFAGILLAKRRRAN